MSFRLNILPLEAAVAGHSGILSVEGGAQTQPPSLTFHGTKPPVREIQTEKPVMRMAAYLIASGASLKTVAEECQVSDATVSNWNRQTWFQNLVTTIIHTEFRDDISKMLRAGAVEAVMTIRDIATNGVSEANKLKASVDLLDRFRGKATNFVHQGNNSISENPEQEIARLEKDLRLTN